MNATRSGQKRPASLAELRELQAKRSQKSASPVLSGPVLPSKPRIEKENTSNPALDRAEREGVTTFRGLFSTDASAADPVRDGVPRAQTFTGTQNASTLPIGGIDSGGGFRSFAMLSRNSGSATQPVQKRTKPRNPFDQRSISASSIPRTSHSKDPFQILDDLSNPGGGDGENGGERDDGAISFKGALEGLSKNERNLNSADIVAPEPREPFPLRGQGKSLERTNSCPPFFAALSASRPPIEFPELSTEQAALPRVLPRRNTSGRLTAALAIPGARRDSGNREDVLSTLRSIDQEHAVRSGKFGMNPPPEAYTEHEIPAIWQLYRRVTIVSPEPLMDMFENSTWDREAAAMSDMVASSNESEQGTPSHLYSWEFHVKPGPASTEALRRAFGITRAAGGAVDLRNEDRKELEWWNGIEAKWKTAFLSLYNAYRGGHAPYFYYVGAEFTVLFLGKKHTPSGELQAVISRTTKGFREKLETEGITFEILGDSGQVTSSSQTVDDAQDADERAEQEIDLDADGEAKSEDGEEGNPFAPIKPRQTPPTSGFLRSRHAIRCSGVRNVHALCDFLLSWKDPQPDRRAAHGTPILVSPRIFLHAALARAQIVDKGSATRADEGSNKAGTGPMLYQIELSGSLLLPEDLRVWLGKFVAKGLVLDIGFHDVEPSSEPLCLLDSDGSGTVAVRAGRKTLARIAAKNGMLISRYRSRIDV